MLFIVLKFVGLFLLGSLIFSLLLIIGGLASKNTRYEIMAREVYRKGFWKAEGVSAYEACEIWTRFRDVFGIPAGTATSLGVGDTYPAGPPLRVRREGERPTR